MLAAPQVNLLSKSEEVRRNGVYLLVGTEPHDFWRAPICIGEGGNVNEPRPGRPFRAEAVAT